MIETINGRSIRGTTSTRGARRHRLAPDTGSNGGAEPEALQFAAPEEWIVAIDLYPAGVAGMTNNAPDQSCRPTLAIRGCRPSRRSRQLYP